MELHDQMMNYLSSTELKIIFFELGLDYHKAPGGGFGEKVIWLIEYCTARNELDKLIEACKKQNKTVAWKMPQKATEQQVTPTNGGNVNKAELRKSIADRFSESEFKRFCDDLADKYPQLNFRYERDIPQNISYEGKVHEVIKLFERRHALDILANALIIIVLPREEIKPPPPDKIVQPPPDRPKKVRFVMQLGKLLPDQTFETRVIESAGGEPSGKGKLPYTPEEFEAVLKTLFPNKQEFTPKQIIILNKLGLFSGQHPVANFREKIGQDLYQGLFKDDKVRTALEITLAKDLKNPIDFELRFDKEAGELAHYPWELIAKEDDFLLPRQKVNLTRYIAYGEPTPQLSTSLPLRLLYIISRPKTASSEQEPPANLEYEKTRQALFALEQAGLLEVDVLGPSQATYDNLSNYIDHKQPPHILHFDGHGHFLRQCHICEQLYYPDITQCQNSTCGNVGLEKPKGYLAFETIAGTMDWVAADDLGVLFSGSNLRLVVLSACYSGMVQGETLFAGLAPTLIRAGIPAIVASQLPITFEAASKFVEGFYKSITAYDSLATAVNKGRRQLFRQKEWFIPTIYLRSQDGEGYLFNKP